VHGFGGGVLGYAELARLLGAEQHSTAGASGLDDGRDRTRASRTWPPYVQAYRLQPRAPTTGRYCYGGVVAYEMARQLRPRGQWVCGRLEGMRCVVLEREAALASMLRAFCTQFAVVAARRRARARRSSEAAARLRGRRWRVLERREWDARVEEAGAANFGSGQDCRVVRRPDGGPSEGDRDYDPLPYLAG